MKRIFLKSFKKETLTKRPTPQKNNEKQTKEENQASSKK